MTDVLTATVAAGGAYAAESATYEERTGANDPRLSFSCPNTNPGGTVTCSTFAEAAPGVNAVPTGTVTFSVAKVGNFGKVSPTTCKLAPVADLGLSTCTIQYTANPGGVGDSITASYPGDANYGATTNTIYTSTNHT